MLNYGTHPRHPAISKLVSSDPDGIIMSIQSPTLMDGMDVALRNVPDVPAAQQFATDMQAAIQHTKVLLQAARHRMQHQEKDKRTDAPFAVGDYVMLATKYIKLKGMKSPKLTPRYVGPFQITEMINPVAFRLTLPPRMRIHNVFHASLLKPFIARPGQDLTPPPLIVDDENEYEVEILLDRRHRTTRTKKCKHAGKKTTKTYQYLVRWKGFGPEHDEWISEKELQRSCKKLMSTYDRRKPRTD